MSVRDRMEAKLRAAFAPTSLDIFDESDRHRGHVGARPEGETHFRVVIVSDHFDGLSRVARQQAVYGALSEEMAGPVHALSLKTLTPAEATAA